MKLFIPEEIKTTESTLPKVCKILYTVFPRVSLHSVCLYKHLQSIQTFFSITKVWRSLEATVAPMHLLQLGHAGMVVFLLLNSFIDTHSVVVKKVMLK